MDSLKTSFKPLRVIRSIFTGGRSQRIQSTDTLVTTYGEDVVLTDIQTGLETLVIKGMDTVTCFQVIDDFVVVAYQRSLLIKVFGLSNGNLLKTFKGHSAPVLSMCADQSGAFVATGSADATVKVWDLVHGFCTHSLKGHSGIVSCLKFHPSALTLVSGCDDGAIRVWDLLKPAGQECIALLDGHSSVVRALDFARDGQLLVSAARDQLINTWDLQSLQRINTLPVFESIEQLILTNGLSAVTAGESGVLKLWDLSSNTCLASQQKETNSSFSFTDLIYCPDTLSVIGVTSDQNFLFYSLADCSFARMKQIAGYNEEVLDVKFVASTSSDDSDALSGSLAVLTNTEQIRVYNLQSNNCDILYSHSDTVLALDLNLSWMVSGSKDKSAIAWRFTSGSYVPVAVCLGHTEPVSAIALANKNHNLFFFTGSQDRTIKRWDLAIVDSSDGLVKLKADYTFLAHDKDIQSIAVSPNDKMIASAALDKTAKLWSAIDGSLLGVFKGHKRGLWCVKFSPTDQLIATASTDKTIKLWNIHDLTCVKTFEGHLNTVLTVCFLSAGLQIVSSGSDGLVKLWNVKTDECVATLDNHEDRIWGLTADASEKHIISGSSDSTITIWADQTQQELVELQTQESTRILKQQDLNLYLMRKDYRRAILLTLELDQPFKLLTILQQVHHGRLDADSITGSSTIDDFFSTLPQDKLPTILRYIRDWNTHSKYAHISQSVIYLILKTCSVDKLLDVPNAKEVFESVLAYSERHFLHCNEMLKKSCLVTYTLECMDTIME